MRFAEFTPYDIILLLQGLGVTVALFLATSLIGVFVGVLWGVVRFYRVPVLMQVITFVSEILKNSPVLVQLFFFYYGLPEIGIYIDAFTTGVVALSIAGGAYASDAIRAGILAIDNGILEAAEVSGLSKRVTFTRIVLPIALRTSVRPLGSVLINMILTSSILSTITLNELTGQAKIVASDTFRPFEVYVVLLVVYAALTYLVSLGITLLHRRLNRDLQEQVS